MLDGEVQGEHGAARGKHRDILGLEGEVCSAVVHLAQEKKKSCLKKKSCWKSCWNWSLGPAGEPEEEWEQRPGQPVHGDCSHDQN